MICPYNGFKECDWENCAARMYVKDAKNGPGYIMKVCAIAYNGGEAPRPPQEKKSMIDREELLQAILLEGYTEEQADTDCQQAQLDIATAAFERIKQIIMQAAEQMEQTMEELKRLACEEAIREKEELPRPPRYAGPQNKGRSWTRQPPRLARSCCRKMRR